MPTVRLAAPAFVAFLALGTMLAPGMAADLDAPTGDILLTVSGAVTVTNRGDMAVFDLGLLESLPQVEFTTATIWTQGEHRFTGVTLEALLDAVGADGTILNATAINDYSVEIPVSDAVEGGPIVAYRMDGETMSVRDKGPLWVVYPYDDVREYRSEVIYSRSIWQLDRIDIRP